MSDVGNDLVPPLREHPVVGLDDRDGASVMRLAGELDLYNAADLRAALDQAIAPGPRCIVIDLALVEFVDPTARGVLIAARSRLGQDGLRLAAPQLETRRTLQISGLDRHLTVHDTVDEALLA
jgi:anti-anti-sigma factor